MALAEVPNLGTTFTRYFEFIPALTDELRDQAYRIRHQVYCEELGFEPSQVDRRERDEYDAHSLQCLIRRVPNGAYVACTRLVFARPGNPSYPLPFERTCAMPADRWVVDPRALPRDRIAEVSRLAVVSDYRRRLGEQTEPAPLSDASFAAAPMPRFPYLMMGLYLGTVELAALHGVDTLFVLTEPKLARHFARLGVEIKQIGGAVEHRGRRIPSMMNVQSIIVGLNAVVRPLYDVIADEAREAVRVHGVLPRQAANGASRAVES